MQVLTAGFFDQDIILTSKSDCTKSVEITLPVSQIHHLVAFYSSLKTLQTILVSKLYHHI